MYQALENLFGLEKWENYGKLYLIWRAIMDEKEENYIWSGERFRMKGGGCDGMGVMSEVKVIWVGWLRIS